MKNAVLKIRGVTFGALLLALTCPLASQGQAGSPSNQPESFPWRPVDRIEGTWNVRVAITDCAGGVIARFDAMSLFGANGAFQDTNATPSAERSEAFGYWKRTGNREYQFAFRFFRLDANGANIGSAIVRHSVVLSTSGDEYRSEGTGEFYDVAGNFLFPVCSEGTAVRFK